MENKTEIKDSSVRNRILWLLVIASRLIVGATFIFSGFVKAIDPTGSAIKFEEYFSVLGIGFLSPLSLFFGVVLAAFEFLLGINTLLGSYRKLTSWLVLLVMCFMTPLTLYLAIADPVSDCGCFGDALVLTNWETFFKNVFLLIPVLFLIRYNSLVKGVYNKSVQWLTVLYSLIFALALAWFGVYFQPILDFRPYKVGMSILDAMPGGNIYAGDDYLFVYEKEGIRKEFSLDDIPMNDTTWVFVDRIEKKNISNKKKSSIEDFIIRSGEDDVDIARDILEDPQYTFLLLTPSLENADESEIDKINDLYDYALTYGYNFYCVTASSDSAIAVWQDNTGADYPFYKMDETTIKTIIRGNPGVMLLHKGTIVWKQLPSHLPDEAQLNDKIENLPIGRTWIYDGSKNLGILVLIYTVPMFILLLTEKTVAAIIGKIREARRKRREKKSSLVSPEKQE